MHHLLCYQVRAAAQAPRTVSTTNQFEQPTFDIFGIREALRAGVQVPGFCGDGKFNAPGEECDGTDDTRAARVSAGRTAPATPQPRLTVIKHVINDGGEPASTRVTVR